MSYLLIIILSILAIIYLVGSTSTNSVTIEEKTNKEGHTEKIMQSKDDIVLGKSNGRQYTIPHSEFNRFGVILGATGMGKTVTLKNIYRSFVSKGYPVIYLDAKPSDSLIDFIKDEATKLGKTILGFNCLDYNYYNPLIGSPTTITDKIMCIKDDWSNEYYKTLATNYLQEVIKYLQYIKTKLNFETIIQFLDPKHFISQARSSKYPHITNIVQFQKVKTEDLMGLYNHLMYFIGSDVGQYLSKSDAEISIKNVIQNKEIVYFALPYLQFPEFSKSIGKLIINDIKNAIQLVSEPVLIVMDEYSVFAGEQVLGIVTQGREYGAHLIVGTQSIDNLPYWEDLLANANVMISHRVNSSNTAEELAKYFATKDSYQITHKMTEDENNLQGSFRKTKEFIVHLDSLKSLGKGETYISTKFNNEINKVQINNI